MLGRSPSNILPGRNLSSSGIKRHGFICGHELPRLESLCLRRICVRSPETVLYTAWQSSAQQVMEKYASRL